MNTSVIWLDEAPRIWINSSYIKNIHSTETQGYLLLLVGVVETVHGHHKAVEILRLVVELFFYNLFANLHSERHHSNEKKMEPVLTRDGKWAKDAFRRIQRIL